MIDDPVVQILREAAARGRQLRLAREQAAHIEARTDDGVAEARLANLAIDVTVVPQRGDNAIDTDNSA
jgi:hypothetical protein